jgi:NAD(P)-dependent dehydrogenase (short-subunit alcohol dehydrogenase family)
MYSGSKAAVVHFNRTISYCYHLDNIRTYATAPGTIKTNLLSGEEWKSFPEHFFTPMSTLVTSVLKLVDGGDLEDSNGKKYAEKDAWGLTVEVNGDNMYFRDPIPAGDQNMEDMMKFTSMKNQLARIEKAKQEQNGA